jgi:hypothetical protein
MQRIPDLQKHRELEREKLLDHLAFKSKAVTEHLPPLEVRLGNYAVGL